MFYVKKKFYICSVKQTKNMEVRIEQVKKKKSLYYQRRKRYIGFPWKEGDTIQANQDLEIRQAALFKPHLINKDGSKPSKIYKDTVINKNDNFEMVFSIKKGDKFLISSFSNKKFCNIWHFSTESDGLIVFQLRNEDIPYFDKI